MYVLLVQFPLPSQRKFNKYIFEVPKCKSWNIPKDISIFIDSNIFSCSSNLFKNRLHSILLLFGLNLTIYLWITYSTYITVKQLIDWVKIIRKQVCMRNSLTMTYCFLMTSSRSGLLGRLMYYNRRISALSQQLYYSGFIRFCLVSNIKGAMKSPDIRSCFLF